MMSAPIQIFDQALAAGAGTEDKSRPNRPSSPTAVRPAACMNAAAARTPSRRWRSLHVDYLNHDYNRDVIRRWQEEGCYDEIRRRIGYRFVLRSDAAGIAGRATLSHCN